MTPTCARPPVPSPLATRHSCSAASAVPARPRVPAATGPLAGVCGVRNPPSIPRHAAGVTKPTLRTERQSALLGRRFPFLLAATGSQTAVSCWEGVIESTSTDAKGFTLRTRAGLTPLSFPPQRPVCNSSAVGQKYKRESGSGTSSLPTSTIFQQTNIYILLYIYTHVRRHVHTDRTERKRGIAGKGESHNPAVRPGALCFVPPLPKRAAPASSWPPRPRVSLGRSRGCSRLRLQLEVAVMGFSSSRSRLEPLGCKLL